MRILIIDNYDSFTFNLAHDLERLENVDVDVFRNDVLAPSTILEYDAIVLSPGPGLPAESGRLMEYVDILSSSNIPVLGVCLGLQAMVEWSGGGLKNLGTVMHGTSVSCSILQPSSLFTTMDTPLEVGLYHSWAAVEESLPPEWIITAKSEGGTIMAIEHTQLPWTAVQFHPESVLTPKGKILLSNWVKGVQ